jgi:hypothetical protein
MLVMTSTSEVTEAPIRTRPLERLEAQMVELAGQIAGATCELLLMVGEYDAVEGWRTWDLTSTAAWLSWHCGVGPRAAREQVRVARALREFPQLVEPFRAGRLSYSKVRAITRVATAATIETLIDWALGAPAAQLERNTAGRQRSKRLEEVRAQQTGRSLSWHWDDDGSLVGSFRLPPEEGIRLLHALEVGRGITADVPPEVAHAEIESAMPSVATGMGGSAEPPTGLDLMLAQDEAATPQRRQQRISIDVLMELLDRAVATIEAGADEDDDGAGLPGLGRERFSLVLHAAGEGISGGVTTEDGVGLHSEVGLRLTCDCSVAVQADDASGNPLHLGRKTRRIRGRLARAVHARDGGRCQAPGCGNRTTQIHHIVHWASGGLTCIENLISLCGRHHWLVHEGGWAISGAPRQWIFRSPHGKVMRTNSAPAPASVPLARNDEIAADAARPPLGPERFSVSEAVAVLWHKDQLAAATTE